MELFTRETIGNYTSDPYAKNDHKYSKEMQEIRKELRKLDQETKKDGGVVDWNRMLNDFMWLFFILEFFGGCKINIMTLGNLKNWIESGNHSHEIS